MRVWQAPFAAVLCIAAIGCNKDSSNFDPNYKTNVNLTDAQKATEQKNQEKFKAPGTIVPGQPIPGGKPGAAGAGGTGGAPSQDGAMKLPPGKRGG